MTCRSEAYGARCVLDAGHDGPHHARLRPAASCCADTLRGRVASDGRWVRCECGTNWTARAGTWVTSEGMR